MELKCPLCSGKMDLVNEKKQRYVCRLCLSSVEFRELKKEKREK